MSKREKEPKKSSVGSLDANVDIRAVKPTIHHIVGAITENIMTGMVQTVNSDTSKKIC